MKLLKDFSQKELVECADGCQYCEAKYRARVSHLMDDNFGTVEWTIQHSPECPESGYECDSDVAGWEYSKDPFTFKGIKYYPLIRTGNITMCLKCENLIISVPIILFLPDRKRQLNFCHKCIEQDMEGWLHQRRIDP